MLSTTSTHAAPRVSVRTPLAPRHGAYRGFVDAATLAEEFCSPAGLHKRPWLERLRRALADDRFVLHFQPIVSLEDGTISHHEALLRLADDPHGLIAPGRFLPAPERYGLIREIDRLVLGERERCLRRYDVEPCQLVIEVTETAAISDMQSASEFCAGVLALGCGLALDDFGAGFGSFQYLKHLPFSHLKIDGDFIRRLPVSRTDQLVVRALAGVVRGMGRRTIAEFVGDQTTMEMLRSYGVDYAQGYEVGRPSPDIPVVSSAAR